MIHITKTWLKAAIIRAFLVIVCTFFGVFTICLRLGEVNWILVIFSSILAGLYAAILSSFGLPETRIDGTIEIDTSDPEKDVYQLRLNDNIDSLVHRKSVRFVVDPKANLSHK